MSATVYSGRSNGELLGLSETLALQILAAVLLLGFHLLSARLLQTESYGALSFGLNIAGLLALVCALGYPDLVMRQVASARVAAQWGILKGVVGQAAKSTALSSVLVATALAAISASGWLDDPGQVIGFQIAALAVLFYPLGFVRGKLARGLGAMKCSIIPEDIVRPAVFIGLLWLVVIGFGLQLGASGLLLILAASLILSMAMGLLCLRNCVPFPWRTTKSEYRPAEWRKSSRRMMVGGIFQEVLLRSDLIALGIFAGMQATAQFSVCSKLALLNVFVLKVIDTFFAPHIAVAFNAGDSAKVRRLIVRTGIYSLAGSLPVAIVLVMFPEELLSAFGPDYVMASTALQILALGTLINAATGAIGSALLMTNNEIIFARIAVLIAISNVVAHLLFTPIFGVVGAAVITSVSVAGQNLLMAGAAYSRLFRNG